MMGRWRKIGYYNKKWYKPSRRGKVLHHRHLMSKPQSVLVSKSFKVRWPIFCRAGIKEGRSRRMGWCAGHARSQSKNRWQQNGRVTHPSLCHMDNERWWEKENDWKTSNDWAIEKLRDLNGLHHSFTRRPRGSVGTRETIHLSCQPARQESSCLYQ